VLRRTGCCPACSRAAASRRKAVPPPPVDRCIHCQASHDPRPAPRAHAPGSPGTPWSSLRSGCSPWARRPTDPAHRLQLVRGTRSSGRLLTRGRGHGTRGGTAGSRQPAPNRWADAQRRAAGDSPCLSVPSACTVTGMTITTDRAPAPGCTSRYWCIDYRRFDSRCRALSNQGQSRSACTHSCFGF